MSPQLIVRALDERRVVATWDRVFLHVWRGEVTPHGMAEMTAVARAWVSEQPDRSCSSLAVIESTSPPPSDRVRPLLTAFFRELAPKMIHQLFVAEGSGFRIAAVRGVALAVSALAPSFLPFKFAHSVGEAATVLAPALSPTAGGAAALVEAVEQARARLGQGAHAEGRT